jgi:hypothetical protein
MEATEMTKFGKLIVLSILLAACTRNNTARVCVPGEQIECACAGEDKPGAQACLEDGYAYGECQCKALIGGPDISSSSDLQSQGADLAGSDLFYGLPQGADMANAVFNGIMCGTGICPVGGNGGCCHNIGANLHACLPDLMTCTLPGSSPSISRARCDGPEDCPGVDVSGRRDRCSADVKTLADNDAYVDSNAVCDFNGKGSVTSTTSNGPTMITVHSVVCHSNADCAGFVGAIPALGDVAFDHCCNVPKNPFTFCAPAGFASSKPGATCQ